MVHNVFAVLQTQGSLFQVHHSLLWRVHQSTGYGDTWNPRDKIESSVKDGQYYAVLDGLKLYWEGDVTVVR